MHLVVACFEGMKSCEKTVYLDHFNPNLVDTSSALDLDILPCDQTPYNFIPCAARCSLRQLLWSRLWRWHHSIHWIAPFGHNPPLNLWQLSCQPQFHITLRSFCPKTRHVDQPQLSNQLLQRARQRKSPRKRHRMNLPLRRQIRKQIQTPLNLLKQIPTQLQAQCPLRMKCLRA